MKMTEKEFNDKGKKLFGENSSDWKFKCTHCGHTQSLNSAKEQFKKGIASMRYGVYKKDDGPSPSIESECLSSTCNWVAYGLISSNTVVVRKDGSEQNIFPFAG